MSCLSLGSWPNISDSVEQGFIPIRKRLVMCHQWAHLARSVIVVAEELTAGEDWQLLFTSGSCIVAPSALWRLPSRGEASWLVPPWVLHVLWLYCVVSSTVMPYHNVLWGCPSAVAMGCNSGGLWDLTGQQWSLPFLAKGFFFGGTLRELKFHKGPNNSPTYPFNLPQEGFSERSSCLSPRHTFSTNLWLIIILSLQVWELRLRRLSNRAGTWNPFCLFASPVTVCLSLCRALC